MMKMKPKIRGVPSVGGGGGYAPAAWWPETIPGGMLVQKRYSDLDKNLNSVSNIKVRVEYGSSYHQIILSSKSSFGDLKKLLGGPTGLHPQDQKLIFKEKEMDSEVILETAGVKNGSKMIVIEDELSRERRYIEPLKNEKMDKALKDISAVRFEVDKLAKQVESIEFEVSEGNKVVETILSNLIELLMTQLIKLDSIEADGDVKLQRRMEVKRVQKFIESLDMLKIRNCGKGKVTLEKQNQQRKHGK